jgi:pimeloyl-ACP methyl ester carboxylesterase
MAAAYSHFVSTAPAQPPAELGRVDGLHYALFRPAGRPRGGVIVLHGAGSRKENHFDFARRCADSGLSAVACDLRGHGQSTGILDAGVLADVATVAGVLPPGPVAVRGSSMGSFVAVLAGARMGAAAVVAICPPSAEALALALRSGRYDIAADEGALEALLAGADLSAAASALGPRLLLQHAEGDERVPVAHSRALHAAAPGSRLTTVAGGDHRFAQHHPALMAQGIDFILERVDAER